MFIFSCILVVSDILDARSLKDLSSFSNSETSSTIADSRALSERVVSFCFDGDSFGAMTSGREGLLDCGVETESLATGKEGLGPSPVTAVVDPVSATAGNTLACDGSTIACVVTDPENATFCAGTNVKAEGGDALASVAGATPAPCDPSEKLPPEEAVGVVMAEVGFENEKADGAVVVLVIVLPKEMVVPVAAPTLKTKGATVAFAEGCGSADKVGIWTPKVLGALVAGADEPDGKVPPIPVIVTEGLVELKAKELPPLDPKVKAEVEPPVPAAAEKMDGCTAVTGAGLGSEKGAAEDATREGNVNVDGL